MKIKRTTWFLVVLAVLLGGITAVVVQTQEPASQEAEEQNQQDIFAFSEEQVQSLSLQTQSDRFKFQREGDGWQMVEPEQAPASEASIVFLLNLMTTGKSDRAISVPAADRAEFGLDEALATIEVTLDNQETHKLVLGGYDFNRSFIYALADPPDDENAEMQVLLVSPNFENAVTRPYEEWKQTAAEPGSEGSASSEESASPSTESATPSEAAPGSEATASPSPQTSESPTSGESEAAD